MSPVQGVPGLQTTRHTHTHLSLALVFLTGCEKQRDSNPGPSQQPWCFLKPSLGSFHRPFKGGGGEDLKRETPGQPRVAGRKVTPHLLCHSCLPGWRFWEPAQGWGAELVLSGEQGAYGLPMALAEWA